MQVHFDINTLPEIKNAIVSQGTFDGVHLAHKKIIERLKQIASIKDGETVLITFEPHPRMVLFPDDHGLQLLSTLNEKIHLLEKAGIDHLIILPFTKEFSRQTSEQFIRTILVNKIKTNTLVIGYDHRFGKNREGSFEHLKESSSLYGFEVEEIPEQDIDDIAVSSTKIRSALLNNDIQTAQKYLGNSYSLEGKVVKGKQLGRTIGYPTANIQVENTFKLIPQDGVYAVWVWYNKARFGGMLNIGNNPTIADKGRSIEVNIFDFEKEIYTEMLKIEFVNKLRNEEKFNGLDALKAQLHLDKQNALAILNKA
ncbi:MAG: bifunctional riboflavin kinase/FAD synthetase [Bacteroidia bacterium]|nr:bifunctional riboflavin kinase/FAD synthetase [Bacteroidia bacterium]